MFSSAKPVAGIRLALLIALGAAFWSVCGDALHAQVAPGAAPNLKIRTRQSGVVTDLREKNFAALDEPQFNEFFNDYYLQLFARPDANLAKASAAHSNEKIKTLAELRSELRTKYFGAGKSGAPYNRLNDLVFTMMKAIIGGDFPIAVKYNAMLVIGDLNESEFDAATGTKLKPYVESLKFMLKAVKGAKVPDYLRVPALVGIMRHAEIHPMQPMPPDLRPVVAKTMLELLAQRDPPPNRSPEAQAWLRRMAAEALGNMKEPGLETGNEVLSALATAVKDPQNPLSVRCAAAQAFGDMKLPGNADLTGLCLDVASLWVTACKKEVEWATTQETEPNRRRLAACAFSIRLGVFGPDAKHGLQVGVPEEKKEIVAKIRSNLIQINKLLEKEPVRPTDLKTTVASLEELIKANGKAVAVAGPPTADLRGKPVAQAQ